MTQSAESTGQAEASLSRGVERRTGLAFLSLMLATNFIPWIQLAERAADETQAPSPGQSVLVIGSCLLAACLVIAGWLLGRRMPAQWGPRVPRPRDAGLSLAILVATLNLALASVIHWRTAGGSVSFHGELTWFGVAWYGMVLPAQTAAAYCKGRASVPILDDARPSH